MGAGEGGKHSKHMQLYANAYKNICIGLRGILSDRLFLFTSGQKGLDPPLPHLPSVLCFLLCFCVLPQTALALVIFLNLVKAMGARVTPRLEG